MSGTVRYGAPIWLPLALGLALLPLLGLLACATRGGPAASGDAAELRVGVAPGPPPLVYREHGELVGIEPELAERIGRGLGREVRFVELPEEELIPALRAHRVDVLMSGLPITPERSAQVLFTRPYLRVGQQALIRREDAQRFGDSGALRQTGARVGFVRGSAGGSYVGRELRSSEAYAFASEADALRSLHARRIDFFIHDATFVWRELSSNEAADLIVLEPSLTREYLAWAVAPDDAALKARIDALLLAWRAGGELDALLARWIPGRQEAYESAP